MPQVVQGRKGRSVIVAPVIALVEALKRGLDCEDKLEPGDYPLHGEVVVKLDCTLSKAKGTEASVPVKFDLDRLLCKVMIAAGVPLEGMADVIDLVAAECTDDGAPVDDFTRKGMDMVHGCLERVKEQVKATRDKKPCEGATRVSGSVTIEGFNPR